MIQFFRQLISRFKNLNFKTKLLISYAVFISIPLIMVTVIAYFTAAQHIESQVMYSARQAFEQTDSFLTYKLNVIINVSDIMYYDTRVQDVFNLHRDENINIGLLNHEMINLTATLLSVLKTNEDIYHVRFYVNDESLISEGNYYFFQFEHMMQHPFFDKLLKQREKVIWATPEPLELPRQTKLQVISMIRGIRSSSRLNEFIGMLRIDIQEDTIENIISKANVTRGSYTYIVNDDDELISQAYVSEHERILIDKTILDRLIRNGIRWTRISIGNQNYFVGCNTIAGTDWTLVSVVPYRNIQSAGISIRNRVFLVAILVMIVAYLFAYFVTVMSMKRIGRLAMAMQKVQEGEFSKITISGKRDEIGKLEENFNYMVQTLSSMIAERVKTGQEKKTAELKALQAQINPHFLYNTLDLINWTALRNGIPSISDIVQALAMFYKLSLNKGKDIVPIRDEIAHVKIYLEIQNTRFENKIHYSFSVDDSVLEYLVPKIILQPLVENSIIHGILEKAEKTGSIRISGQREGNDIILSVEDDGVGLSAKMMETILVKDNGGYGVTNIDQRIKHYYGNNYGLSYRSTPAEGTTVTIVLPVCSADSTVSNE